MELVEREKERILELGALESLDFKLFGAEIILFPAVFRRVSEVFH